MKLHRYTWILLLISIISTDAVADWYLGLTPIFIDSRRSDIEAARITRESKNAISDRGAVGDAILRDKEDSIFSGNIYIGFRDGQFGFEIAYSDLGTYETRAKASGTRAEDLVFVTTTGKFKANALSVSSLGYLAVGQRSSVFTKIGVVRWKATNKVRNEGIDLDIDPGTGDTISIASFSTTIKSKEYGTDPLFGVGFEHRRAEFVLRLSFDRYLDVGSDKSDITTYGLGVLFPF